MRRLLFTTVALLLLAACGSKPPAPDWEINAQSALARYVKAFMAGDTRVEGAEFARARSELQATGQAGLVARAELTRCAVQVATLTLQPCDGFEALRADSPAAERAYADFLAGRLAPDQASSLPAQYRTVAAGSGDVTGIAIDDPLSRLIAAGVLVRTNRASPQVLAAAVETASQQGWRRALLAWLGAQLQRAKAAGELAETARLQRRIDLASGG